MDKLWPMDLSAINNYLGNIDIYLLDQVLKQRFHPGIEVLDAGCGEGRNLMYFLNAGYPVHGIDKDPVAVDSCRFVARSIRPDLSKDRFMVADVTELPFEDSNFDLIISSAVLHFADSEDHFLSMLKEMVRCLKPGGILFLRTASNIGIEDKIKDKGSGRYLLGDGSVRFLLTRRLLEQIEQQFQVKYLEPFKTVNVNDLRCMSTLVLSFN